MRFIIQPPRIDVNRTTLVRKLASVLLGRREEHLQIVDRCLQDKIAARPDPIHAGLFRLENGVPDPGVVSLPERRHGIDIGSEDQDACTVGCVPADSMPVKAAGIDIEPSTSNIG